MGVYEFFLLVYESLCVCLCVYVGDCVSIVTASWLVPMCGKVQGCAGFGSQPQSSDPTKIQSIQEDTHAGKSKR